jgi:regulator of replication initiation timing
MVKQAALARSTELEPIDRLEEKVKLLVAVVTQLRRDLSRATDENARYARELDGLRARVADSEASSSELTVLRDEREIIRTRVAEMLEQLEAI